MNDKLNVIINIYKLLTPIILRAKHKREFIFSFKYTILIENVAIFVAINERLMIYY